MKKIIEMQGNKITLAQFLKYVGFCENGGQAKLFCHEKKVLLNGNICIIPGQQLKEADEICLVSNKEEVAVFHLIK